MYYTRWLYKRFNLVSPLNTPTFLRTHREVHLTTWDDAAGRRILYYIVATTPRPWTDSAIWPRWIAYWFSDGFLKYNWCLVDSRSLLLLLSSDPPDGLQAHIQIRYIHLYSVSEMFQNFQFVGPEIIYFTFWLLNWYT